MTIELTKLQPEHLQSCVELSASVGWPHQRKDWEMLLPFSTGFVAIKEGKVLGTALRSDFGQDISTINMVIVAEALRGQGLGRSLVVSLIEKHERAIRLVSTVSGKPLYQKLGFQEIADVVQHQGGLVNAPEVAGADHAEAHDVRGILDLERHSFGGDRAPLVDWMMSNARVSVIRQKGSIAGYAACRPFGRGYVIGPVVADNVQDAQALIAQLLQGLAGQFVRLDILRNDDLSSWLINLGLLQTSQPPIMQRGDGSISPRRLVLFSQALA